jgi:Domain of unknown function (DUF1707)
MPNDTPPRISENERDTAVQRLQEAFAAGHLSHDELEERLQTALTARTGADFVRVLDSLPETESGRFTRIVTTGGRIQRSGAWRVPRVFHVESEFGKVDLDLSRAVIEHSVVDIELKLRFGKAKLTVPPDAVVELDELRSDWKQPVYEAPRRSGSGGQLIRVSGEMGFGRLVVRHARR